MKTRDGMLIGIVMAIVLALMAAAGTAEAVNLQAWDQQINGPGRFRVLAAFGKEAVLDKETGLVWEQSPSTHLTNWIDAQLSCSQTMVGSRLGWRLPTLQELASLVDRSQSNPTLPLGHPFSNVQFFYWSATSTRLLPDFAWGVEFFGGSVNAVDKSFRDVGSAWCVRGGQGGDPQ